MSKFTKYLKSLVNISDHVDIEQANASIRRNITFRGPNVVILACAIIIASVGLNINSIPVIIGAMLISPLMGPIIGLGLGLGTNDMGLVRVALRNLAVMVVISVIASTLYFLLSPLNLENPTELLARTNPTIYDVLIALFGGFAGIIEISRKEKGTVFSGVAIATALMPPLCTVGYGIAHLNFTYMLGALYLFFINGVFIALATFLTVKYLRFPVIRLSDEGQQKKLTRTIFIIVLCLIIPSVWSAVVIIKENNFNRNVSRFIEENRTTGKSYIYDHKTDMKSKPPTVELYVAGEELQPEDRESLYDSAEEFGFRRNQLIIKEEATILRTEFSEQEMIKGIYERNDQELHKREQTINDLQKQLNDYKSKDLPYTQIAREIVSQYPDIEQVSIARGEDVDLSKGAGSEQIFVITKWSSGGTGQEAARLEQWLKVRLGYDHVKVIIQ